MIYTPCKKCRSGYVYEKNDQGVDTARPCECLIEERFCQALIRSGVYSVYHPHLSVDGGAPKMSREQKAMRSTVKTYVKDVKGNVLQGNGLYFYGSDRGTGKTTHLFIILKESLRSGFGIKSIHWVDYLTLQIRDESGWADALNADVLMVDELGKESFREDSAFPRSAFEYLVRNRVSAGRPLLLASNLEYSEFTDHYGDGVTSLMHEKMKVIPVHGVDWRIK